MIKILFIRSERAYLPEIEAYVNYFNKFDDFKAYDSHSLEKYTLDEFDVLWEFKGFSRLKKKPDQILIHEYASLSTGSYPFIKNHIKTKLNTKPDLRVFLNENVHKGFNFNDNIEYCYRDMGIDSTFSSQKNNLKEYDFVYIGSICKEREMDRLLEAFTANSKAKFCLIGDIENEIYDAFKSHKNLTFTGRVKYSEVPMIAQKARYGVNFIPDKYPFNIQTSTKLLEYLAMGLDVITTDYLWVREFEAKNECNFYKLNYKKLCFDIKEIENYKFSSNFNASNHMWDTIIEKANVKNWISKMVHTMR